MFGVLSYLKKKDKTNDDIGLVDLINDRGSSVSYIKTRYSKILINRDLSSPRTQLCLDLSKTWVLPWVNSPVEYFCFLNLRVT